MKHEMQYSFFAGNVKPIFFNRGFHLIGKYNSMNSYFIHWAIKIYKLDSEILVINK